MRLTAVVFTLTLVAAVPASGQTAPDAHPYGLDPYKPSDAALLRSYGVTLLSQTPLPELSRLDPYKPSHAALLRQLGGALPLWGLAWYPLQAAGPVLPLQLRGSPETPVTVLVARREDRERASAYDMPAAGPPSPTRMGTLRRPEGNDGVWITFDGRRWVSAGKAIPLDEAAFERVGEHESFPVYRRQHARDDTIYIPTRNGLIAPFRPKSRVR